MSKRGFVATEEFWLESEVNELVSDIESAKLQSEMSKELLKKWPVVVLGLLVGGALAGMLSERAQARGLSADDGSHGDGHAEIGPSDGHSDAAHMDAVGVMNSMRFIPDGVQSPIYGNHASFDAEMGKLDGSDHMTIAAANGGEIDVTDVDLRIGTSFPNKMTLIASSDALKNAGHGDKLYANELGVIENTLAAKMKAEGIDPNKYGLVVASLSYDGSHSAEEKLSTPATCIGIALEAGGPGMYVLMREVDGVLSPIPLTEVDLKRANIRKTSKTVVVEFVGQQVFDAQGNPVKGVVGYGPEGGESVFSVSVDGGDITVDGVENVSMRGGSPDITTSFTPEPTATPMPEITFVNGKGEKVTAIEFSDFEPSMQYIADNALWYTAGEPQRETVIKFFEHNPELDKILAQFEGVKGREWKTTWWGQTFPGLEQYFCLFEGSFGDGTILVFQRKDMSYEVIYVPMPVKDYDKLGTTSPFMLTLKP